MGEDGTGDDRGTSGIGRECSQEMQSGMVGIMIENAGWTRLKRAKCNQALFLYWYLVPFFFQISVTTAVDTANQLFTCCFVKSGFPAVKTKTWRLVLLMILSYSLACFPETLPSCGHKTNETPKEKQGETNEWRHRQRMEK